LQRLRDEIDDRKLRRAPIAGNMVELRFLLIRFLHLKHGLSQSDWVAIWSFGMPSPFGIRHFPAG